MGSLIAEVPYSEVTATLEVLASIGITRRDLKFLRLLKSQAYKHAQERLLSIIKQGSLHDPIPREAELALRSGDTPRHRILWHSAPDRTVWAFTRFTRKNLKRPKTFAGKTIEEILKTDFFYWTTANRNLPLPMTANMLDFFLAYPQSRPKTWEGKNVIFGGTLFIGTDGGRYFGVLPIGGWKKGLHITASELLPKNHYFAVY